MKKFKKLLASVLLSVCGTSIPVLAAHESTFVIIKPDCAKYDIETKIMSMIKAKGYEISKTKRMMLTEEMVKKHYSHHADKPFFSEILEYMLSGEVVAMVVTGENVVKGMRDLAGDVGVEGTIRGEYGKNKCENGFHRSDSLTAAQEEIKRFF